MLTYKYYASLFGILQVFQLPTALAYPLFYKLAQPGASTVSLQAVQSWIVQQKVMQVGYLLQHASCFALLF